MGLRWRDIALAMLGAVLFLAVVVGLALLAAGQAEAYTCDAGSCTVEVQYLEPTTNVDGSALKDLATTTLFYSTPGQAEKSTPQPASTSSGGGQITRSVILALASGQSTTMTAQTTATNARGIASQRSPVVTLTVTNSTSTDPPPPVGGAPTIGTASLGPTAASYVVSWGAVLDPPSGTPVPTYRWSAGYNDGESPLQGTAGTNSFTLVLPYHTSGQPKDFYTCYRPVDSANQAASDASCSGGMSPAKPPAVTGDAAPIVSKIVAGCSEVKLEAAGAPPANCSPCTAVFRMDDNLAFGTADPDPPYLRTKKNIPAGTHSYYIEWFQGSTRVLTTKKAQVACP